MKPQQCDNIHITTAMYVRLEGCTCQLFRMNQNKGLNIFRAFGLKSLVHGLYVSLLRVLDGLGKASFSAYVKM